MASKCISNLAQFQPPSVSPNSLNYSLQMPLQTSSITASKVHTIMVFQVQISKLTRSWPPSICQNSLDYGLQVRTIMPCKCIFTLTRPRSRSASPYSLDHGLEVYLQICSITTSKYIPKLAPSRPERVSLNSHDRHFQAHLNFALKHHLQPVLIYGVDG